MLEVLSRQFGFIKRNKAFNYFAVGVNTVQLNIFNILALHSPSIYPQSSLFFLLFFSLAECFVLIKITLEELNVQIR